MKVLLKTFFKKTQQLHENGEVVDYKLKFFGSQDQLTPDKWATIKCLLETEI